MLVMASSLKNPDFENNTVTKFISSFVMNDGEYFFLDSKQHLYRRPMVEVWNRWQIVGDIPINIFLNVGGCPIDYFSK